MQGDWRAQPGPDETVGGKVWAFTGSVTKVWPLLEPKSQVVSKDV